MVDERVGVTAPIVQERSTLSEEELLPGLVREETRVERERSTKEEPAEELIPIQIHSMDPTKTTKVGALLCKGA